MFGLWTISFYSFSPIHFFCCSFSVHQLLLLIYLYFEYRFSLSLSLGDVCIHIGFFHLNEIGYDSIFFLSEHCHASFVVIAHFKIIWRKCFLWDVVNWFNHFVLCISNASWMIWNFPERLNLQRPYHFHIKFPIQNVLIAFHNTCSIWNVNDERLFCFSKCIRCHCVTPYSEVWFDHMLRFGRTFRIYRLDRCHMYT